MTYTVFTLYAIRGPWYRRDKRAICTFLDWREAMATLFMLQRTRRAGDAVRYTVGPSQMGWKERLELNAWRSVFSGDKCWK